MKTCKDWQASSKKYFTRNFGEENIASDTCAMLRLNKLCIK